jgi:outer membrane biogenesis lipoprotein LolB
MGEVGMKYVLIVVASVLLAACAGMNSNNQDEPDDKVMQTGSHIPVKDKSAGKASGTADADALMRSQKVLGGPSGVSGAAGRSN